MFAQPVDLPLLKCPFLVGKRPLARA